MRHATWETAEVTKDRPSVHLDVCQFLFALWLYRTSTGLRSGQHRAVGEANRQLSAHTHTHTHTQRHIAPCQMCPCMCQLTSSWVNNKVSYTANSRASLQHSCRKMFWPGTGRVGRLWKSLLISIAVQKFGCYLLYCIGGMYVCMYV